MTRSRSPKAVLLEAYLAATLAWPKYAHRFSRKKFTQHQLFACLVLKDFYGLSYRGVADMLRDCSDLREAIRLEQVPHFTALQKAAVRLLVAPSFQRLLAVTVRRARACGLVRRRPKLAAIDTSGFESRHRSRYFASRRKTSGKHGRKRKVVYQRFPKLGLTVDVASHFILAARTGQGPRPDHAEFAPRRGELLSSCTTARPKAVAADAGFDSERAHQLARDRLGIQSLINPTHGRPSTKEPTGRYRRQMKRHLKQSRSTQRWQVETVVSNQSLQRRRRRRSQLLGKVSPLTP